MDNAKYFLKNNWGKLAVGTLIVTVFTVAYVLAENFKAALS